MRRIQFDLNTSLYVIISFLCLALFIAPTRSVCCMNRVALVRRGLVQWSALTNPPFEVHLVASKKQASCFTIVFYVRFYNKYMFTFAERVPVISPTQRFSEEWFNGSWNMAVASTQWICKLLNLDLTRLVYFYILWLSTVAQGH